MTLHDLARPDALIRYWTTGAEDDPTVVLLHGATLDHHSWTPQIEALRDRFHVVAPDLRGHGRSTGRFDFRAAVDDILALLDRLTSGPVVLVGLSLGSNLAQEVVRREPHRVRALVAADSTCNTTLRHPMLASVTAAGLRTYARVKGDGFPLEAARATARVPEVQRYALDANAHRSNRETVDIIASLLYGLRSRPGYRLPVPALLVRGEHDRLGDIATGTPAWARREPLARYAVIPDAGHASNLDNPAAFTATLRTFLDSVLPEPTAHATAA